MANTEKYQPLKDVPTLQKNFGDKKSTLKSLAERVSLFNGDITALEVDVIVNAANSSLRGSDQRGVDNAIHTKAGEGLRAECEKLKGCNTGDAKLTGNGTETGKPPSKLHCKYVVHTVGPVYDPNESGKCAELLASCYRRSFERVAEKGNECKSVALPIISTGIYGFPLKDAACIAMGETLRFLLSEKSNNVERVIFAIFEPKDFTEFEKIALNYFPLSR